MTKMKKTLLSSLLIVFFSLIILSEISCSSGNKAYSKAKAIKLFNSLNIRSEHIIHNFKIYEDASFRGCVSLAGINIPAKVTEIGSEAFQGCISLTEITIPRNVSRIGENAFGDCINLAAINAASDNAVYTSEDGVLYNKNKTFLHTYPAGKTNASFTIPESVASIENGAFSGCVRLTSVTFEGTIDQDNFYGDVFYNLGDLRSKYLAGGPGTYIRVPPSLMWNKQE